MFNYKLGDVIEATRDHPNHKAGQLYQIVAIHSDTIVIRGARGDSIGWYGPAITNTREWFKPYRETIKSEPKNEVEWLDRIQQNFKE